MVLKTKQENHSDLGKQTIEKYRCWQYAQPQNQHDLEGEGAGEQRKVLFIQRNLFLLNICNLQPIAQEATWRYFPHKRESWVVMSRCSSGLWREVHHPSRRSIFTVLVSLWWKFTLLKQEKKKGEGCALIYRTWFWLQAVNQLRTARTSQTGQSTPSHPQWPHVQCFKE